MDEAVGEKDRGSPKGCSAARSEKELDIDSASASSSSSGAVPAGPKPDELTALTIGRAGRGEAGERLSSWKAGDGERDL